MNKSGPAAGFTLMELAVVVVIIGLLSAISLAQYRKSAESALAESAAAFASEVAHANRMFYTDKGFYTSGMIVNACITPTCPSSGSAANPCNLVACGYIKARNFDAQPYVVLSQAATDCAAVGTFAGATGAFVACAYRRQSGKNSSSTSPYNTWGYAINNYGIATVVGSGAPTPSQ